VEVNEQRRLIRLPYAADKVKAAPAYESGVDLDDRAERELNSFYGLGARRSQGSPASQTPSEPRSKARHEGGSENREGATLKLHEEELKVGKRSVEAGGIRLRKIVRTEIVNQPVELTREEIVVERVPAGQKTGGACAQDAFKEEDIYIPLRREEAVVEKNTRVREEVRVSKNQKSERQSVSERVRREDVDVSNSGQDFSAGQNARAVRPSGQSQSQASGRSQGTRSVFGLFKNNDQTSRAVDQLKAAGFSSGDVSVLFPDKRGTRDFAHEKNTKAPEGAATGAGTGAVLGGTVGWLAGAGALAIPGVGPFIAAGPILAALSGAAVGGAAGGLTGALIGMGIPEYEAKRYEGKVKAGGILVSVHVDNRDEERSAKDVLEKSGAEDVSATGEEKVAAHVE
jgi:uncharacterized protein (TIGR02271 family)